MFRIHSGIKKYLIYSRPPINIWWMNEWWSEFKFHWDWCISSPLFSYFVFSFYFPNYNCKVIQTDRSKDGSSLLITCAQLLSGHWHPVSILYIINTHYNVYYNLVWFSFFHKNQRNWSFVSYSWLGHRVVMREITSVFKV